MSFSKSRLDRFGNKLENNTVASRTSGMEVNKNRTGVSKVQGDVKQEKAAYFSKNFTESTGSEETSLGEALEGKPKPKFIARHNCLTKIGKPNTRPSSRNEERVTADTDEEDSTAKEASSTSALPTTKSNIPTIRCASPTTRQRPGTLGSGKNIPPTKAPDFHRRNLEMQYNLKAKRLATLKKELLEKQKPAVEMHKMLLNLRKKIAETEGKELPIEDFKVVEYPEIRTLDGPDLEHVRDKVKELKARLQGYPAIFLDLCRQILDDKCAVLDTSFDDEEMWQQDELMDKLQKYKQEASLLEGHIESKMKEEESKMRDLIKEWHNLVRMHPDFDEDSRQEFLQKMQETEHKLKQTLGDLQFEKNKKLKENEKVRDLEKDMVKQKDKILELNKCVEEEKTRNINFKERQTNLEQKLKTAKGRLKESEIQRQENEMKVIDLETKVRNVEIQSKERDEIHELRQKELQENLKTQTEHIVKLEAEKNSIDSRLEITAAEMKHSDDFYQAKVRDLENQLQRVKEDKDKLEQDYDNYRVENVCSEVYSYQYLALCSKKFDEDEQSLKSDIEVTLWNELKATRSALKLAEEKLSLYAEEKSRFIDTISTEDEHGTVNLTAHLMQKEELITNLILQNKQLKKSLHEMQMELENRNISNKLLEEKINTINTDMLENTNNVQTQIHDLQAKLEEQINRCSTLEQEVLLIKKEKEKSEGIIRDYENYNKIHNEVVKSMENKTKSAEEQNKNLKDYILKMREQLNLTSIETSKREQELKALKVQLNTKKEYILKIEGRIREMEDTVAGIKSKTVIVDEKVLSMDNELRVTREQIEALSNRENRQKFINHVQTLSLLEAINFCEKRPTPIVAGGAIRRPHTVSNVGGTRTISNGPSTPPPTQQPRMPKPRPLTAHSNHSHIWRGGTATGTRIYARNSANAHVSQGREVKKYKSNDVFFCSRHYRISSDSGSSTGP